MNKPDNTLYLNIKQNFFDEIMAGTKKQEFREVKPTTYKKLVQLDENGFEIQGEDGNSLPIKYDAIHFRVGMNKIADEAIVEVLDAHTEVLFDDNGDPVEYVTDEKGHTLLRDEDGKVYTEKEAQSLLSQGKDFWYLEPEFNEKDECINGLYWVAQQVVFDLGEVLDKNIVSKK